jgi:curved DNA-binding protein CbpA
LTEFGVTVVFGVTRRKVPNRSKMPDDVRDEYNALRKCIGDDAAYHRLSRKYHPDKGGCVHSMQVLNEERQAHQVKRAREVEDRLKRDAMLERHRQLDEMFEESLRREAERDKNFLERAESIRAAKRERRREQYKRRQARQRGEQVDGERLAARTTEEAGNAEDDSEAAREAVAADPNETTEDVQAGLPSGDGTPEKDEGEAEAVTIPIPSDVEQVEVVSAETTKIDVCVEMTTETSRKSKRKRKTPARFADDVVMQSCVPEPAVSSLSDDVAMQSTEPAVSSLSDDAAMQSTEPVVSSLSDDVAMQSTEPAVSSLSDDAAMQSTEPAVSSLSDDVAMQSTEPVVSSLSDDAAMQSTEPVVSSLSDDVAMQSTEPVVSSLSDDVVSSDDFMEKIEEVLSVATDHLYPSVSSAKQYSSTIRRIFNNKHPYVVAKIVDDDPLLSIEATYVEYKRVGKEHIKKSHGIALCAMTQLVKKSNFIRGKLSGKKC